MTVEQLFLIYICGFPVALILLPFTQGFVRDELDYATAFLIALFWPAIVIAAVLICGGMAPYWLGKGLAKILTRGADDETK